MKKFLRKTVCLFLSLGLFACGMGGDEDRPSSHLRVLNGSPGLTSADVWVNNTVVVENLEYSMETSYLPVDAVNINIKVSPADSSIWLR